MKRGYTVLEFKQKIRRLRAVRPDISVPSDFIVGFPGETERDFEATMRLIAEIGFDQSFSFVYSARPGTPAAALPDDLRRTRSGRPARCRRARRALPGDQPGMVGTPQRVLVERPSRKDPRELAGAHREQSLGQFRRRSRALDRPVRRRARHRGAAQFAARAAWPA